MPMFGKRIGGGRRKASRETLPLPAMLSTIDNYHMATVVDLSSSGARMRGDMLPDAGQSVAIKLDCVRAFGVVAWSNGGECGVAFDEALSRFELERLRREVKLASLAWRSVDEKLASEDWASGIAR
jgi:PilZ domain